MQQSITFTYNIQRIIAFQNILLLKGISSCIHSIITKFAFKKQILQAIN